jgi:hypothetical protein
MLEIFIALKVHDHFIRPYIGDMLVVVLCYTASRTVFTAKPFSIALAVFLFACTIECLQYGKIINLLGLQNNSFAKIIFGTTFSITDIAMYAMGTVIVYALDSKLSSTNSNIA